MDATLLPDIVIGAVNPPFEDRWQEAARGVVVNDDGLLTMITTPQYGEFGFPGGRANAGESAIDTLVREVREETGYGVVEASVRRLCTVEVVRHHEKLGNINLHQMNHFFLCTARKVSEQHLDDYEAAHGIDVVTVSIEQAIRRNERVLKDEYHFWVDRDLHVLRALQELPPERLRSLRV